MTARPRAQSGAKPRRQPSRSTTGSVAGTPRAPLPRLRLPDGSRSVQSPWVWRGFLFMSLIALGLCLTLALNGHLLYAGAWAFITAGWFAIAMWLWRQHLTQDQVPHEPTTARGGLGR